MRIIDLKKWAFYLTISSVVLFASCSNDDDGKLPDPIVAPHISSLGVSNDTIVQIGTTFDLKPELNLKDTADYSWKIDGREVAKTRNYAFKPEAPGRYEINYRVVNGTCYDEKSVQVNVYKHHGGFYIVNEGWFGHDTGSVNYFDAGADTLATNITAQCAMGTTTQYGAIWNHVFYLVSKQGNRLVAMSLYDYSQVGAIEDMPDGRAFCGIDEDRGVVTTSDGAYIVKLNPLALFQKLDGSDGQCGSVVYTDGRIFVNSQNSGILVYDKNLKKEKTLAKVDVGFAQSKDGNLWAVKDKTLYCINPKTLSVVQKSLPDDLIVSGSWGAWNAGCLSASATENALYLGKSASSWGNGNQIYKYTIDSETGLDAPFATGESDDAFYGAGFRCDPKTGNLVASFTKEYGYDDNRLAFFSGKDGSSLKRITFGRYWFPALVVFN